MIVSDSTETRMSDTDNELMRVRREKLENLRAEGIDPYPNSYHRTHNSDDAIQLLKQTEENNQSEDHAKTSQFGCNRCGNSGNTRDTLCDEAACGRVF